MGIILSCGEKISFNNTEFDSSNNNYIEKNEEKSEDKNHIYDFVVITKYKFKKNKKEPFVDILMSINGLNKVRSFPGCKVINYYDDLEDEDSFILYEKWIEKTYYINYLEIRNKDGYMNLLNDSLLQSPTIFYLKEDKDV